ncbi:regulatory LuxR family protein [Streptomyces sp. 3211.6]|uniref:AAA family ATPase n=1 Tax=Streptomyces TaxID=1883 RepID=UPI0009A4F263|nr:MULTISPECIES: LuxR family transcriptional regulator [Streptomyces]RKT04572.1 regulatory LuxR family protein [Streptomyces sp. 3211.6]
MTATSRASELAALGELHTASLSGEGGTALITGVTAMGKTALLHTFEETAAASGALVLSASASLAERGLPMGVISQLFSGLAPRTTFADRVAGLLEAGALSAAVHGPDDGSQGHVPAPVLHRLWQTVQELAAQHPVLITVDDVDHADATSLQCLLFLIRRIRSVRVLVVLTAGARTPGGELPPAADLFRGTRCTVIPLLPLTPSGVAALLGAHLDKRTAEDLAPSCHRISGGSPMLVRALLEDYLAGNGPRQGELTVGDTFKKTVLSSLGRCPAGTLGTARALAVLADASSCGPFPPELLGDMLGIPAAPAAQALDTLHAIGLLSDGLFRHECGRLAVLDGILPAERARLHGRAGGLLQEAGAPATLVARHLIAAQRLQAPWAVPVLMEAAERAMEDSDIPSVISFLRGAQRVARDAPDSPRRSALLAALARAEWQVDPAAVKRHLAELVPAVADGRATRRDAITTIGYLLWHGRPEEAVESLKHVATDAPSSDSGSLAALDALRSWLACAYPELFDDTTGRPAGTWEATAAGRHELRSVLALLRVLRSDGEEKALDDAERVLQDLRLNGSTLLPALAALGTLVFANRLQRAASWCDSLLEQAAASRTPTSRALFAGARALIAVRQGDLALARDHARTALTLISPQSWGIALGLPVAAMVLACTEMGEHDEAATYLGIPVPEATFRTPAGLHYLHARGRHHLATGRPRSALSDFDACGTLMTRWGLDSPGIVPWRLSAAAAHLVLGGKDAARSLVGDELARLHPGDRRTHGACLRILAATSEPGRRPAILRKAAEKLRTAGDRTELTATLADLSRAHHILGEEARATSLARQVIHLAQQCGNETPLRGSLPHGPKARMAPRVPGSRQKPHALTGVSAPIAELSFAERRVALLAAQGHSNRAIAAELFVTVSTVEQHLTRIYRKLKVRKRSHLTVALLRHPAPQTSGA